MIDVLEALHEFFNSGLTWSSGLAIILAILKIRDSNHSRKLRAQTARDIAEIKGALGIWNATTLNRSSADGRTKRGRLFLLLWAALYRAVPAGPYTISRRKRTMTTINKAILVPLIAAIAAFLKQAFGFELTVEWQDNIVTLAIIATAAVGIFMKFFKKKNQPVVVERETNFDGMGE